MTRDRVVPMLTPKRRDPIAEPHDRSPRWLGEGRATVTTPPTPDEEERRFVPKRNLPCHGEPEMRLGFVRRSDGVEVAFERICPKCRAREARLAEQAAWDAAHNHEARVRAFLQARHVPVVKRGPNTGALVDRGPREPVLVNDRDSTGIDYGPVQMVPDAP